MAAAGQQQHGASGRARRMQQRLRHGQVARDLDARHGRHLGLVEQAAVAVADRLALALQRGGAQAQVQAEVVHGGALALARQVGTQHRHARFHGGHDGRRIVGPGPAGSFHCSAASPARAWPRAAGRPVLRPCSTISSASADSRCCTARISTTWRSHWWWAGASCCSPSSSTSAGSRLESWRAGSPEEGLAQPSSAMAKQQASHARMRGRKTRENTHARILSRLCPAPRRFPAAARAVGRCDRFPTSLAGSAARGAFTLVLAWLTARLCRAAHPAALDAGPLLAVAAAGMAGAPVHSHAVLRNLGQWTIAAALGLYFTPEVTALVLGLWWAIVLGVAWALGLGWAFGHWLCVRNRELLGGLDEPPARHHLLPAPSAAPRR
jgi:hypothetical protein